MSSKPPSARPYDASRRRERAREKRRGVLEAARSRFLADGYTATTMASIAQASGVSVETIYGTWKTKAGLVQALLREALRGEEDAPPLEQSAAIRQVIAEPQPRRQLALYGALLSEIQPSLAPIVKLLREGAPSHPDLAAALGQHKRDRLAAMQRFGELLHSRKALRRGLTAADARDVLWTMNSAEVYELLVLERGWTPARYGEWIADSLAEMLLPAKRRGTS